MLAVWKGQNNANQSSYMRTYLNYCWAVTSAMNMTFGSLRYYFWKPGYYFTFGSVFFCYHFYVQKQLMWLPYFYVSVHKCSHICFTFCFISFQETPQRLHSLCFSFVSNAPLTCRPTYGGAPHTRWRLKGLQWDGEVIGTCDPSTPSTARYTRCPCSLRFFHA
jgi:hypothetical protein